MNNISDEDQAATYAMDIINDETARIRGKVKRGPSFTHCEECGEDIPEDRRTLGGITTCIFCQTLIERAR